MDPWVKRNLKSTITIFPYASKVDGAKVFGDSYTAKGQVISGVKVEVNRNGERFIANTKIYLDPVDVPNILEEDEVQTPYTRRLPIKALQHYPGIKTDLEIIEVLL